MGGKNKQKKEATIKEEPEEEVVEKPTKKADEPKKETKEVKKEKPEQETEEGGEEEEEEDPDAELKEAAAALDPSARRYLFALNALQKEIDELMTEETKELSLLEKKYEDILVPAYQKRKEIVSGEREPTAEEVSKGTKIVEITEENQDEKKDPEQEKPKEEKGVKGIPGFWSTALQNAELDFIEDRDLDALSFLVDISCQSRDNPFEGFTLNFDFAENPYFTNQRLTKTYVTLLEEGDVVLQETTGCKIDWKPGKNLTVVLKKKKQRHKGGGKTRTITKEEPCESFFRFFDYPKEEEEEEDEDDNAQMLMEDFESGCTIKDRVIPKAVEWYTGEALAHIGLKFGGNPMMDFGEGDDDDEGAEGAAPQADQQCKQQ